MHSCSIDAQSVDSSQMLKSKADGDDRKDRVTGVLRYNEGTARAGAILIYRDSNRINVLDQTGVAGMCRVENFT